MPSDEHPRALDALSSSSRKKTSVVKAKKNHAGRNAASFAHRRRAAARFVTGFSVTRPWNSMSEWSQDGMLLNGAGATRRVYPSARPTRATRGAHPYTFGLRRSRSVLRLHDEAEGHPRVPHCPGAECRARRGSRSYEQEVRALSSSRPRSRKRARRAVNRDATHVSTRASASLSHDRPFPRAHEVHRRRALWHPVVRRDADVPSANAA